MANKSILHHISAPKVNMGGHIIDQPLPYQGLDYFDPFLLIHHWNDTMPGGAKASRCRRRNSPTQRIFSGYIYF